MKGRRLFSTSTMLHRTLSAPKFESIFPTLIPYIRSFDKSVQIGIPHREFLRQNETFHDHIAPEIISKLPEWGNLQKMNRKRICYHILRVLYCFLVSEDYPKYNETERNMMYWTMMLHDVCKRGLPVLPTSKDPFHPYSSAAYALAYLTELSGADEALVAKTRALSEKIRNAKKIKVMTYYELRKNTVNTLPLECTDLTRLDEFVQELDSIHVPGGFHNTVTKIIMMHQCIPTLEKFKIDNQLSFEDVGKYVNKQLLCYLKTFAICDSNSYILNVNRHLIPIHRAEFDTVFQKYESICKSI